MNSTKTSSFAGRIQLYAVFAFFAGLVLLPVMAAGLHGERARWQAAKALNQIQQGTVETTMAIESLRDSIAVSPDDQQLKYVIAKILLDNDHVEEALELAESVAENPSFEFAGQNLMVNCLNHLGRFDESLAIYKSIALQLQEYEDAQSDSVGWLDSFAGITDSRWQARAQRLNGLAYHQGLAGKELVAAGINIEEVIDELSARNWSPVRARVSFVERTIISIALIGRQVEQSDKALGILDSYITRLEEASNRQGEDVLKMVNDAMLAEFPFSSDVERTIRQRRAAFQMGRARLATMMVARALLQEDLGQEELSDEDRFRVKAMGFDPNQIVDEFPDDLECLRTLEQAATFLDTRGVVLLQQGKLRLSQRDLDLAVLSIEILNHSFAGGIQNSVMNEGGRFFRESKSRELEASVLYHRMQLAEEMNDQETANTNRLRIDELGFEPGPWLN